MLLCHGWPFFLTRFDFTGSPPQASVRGGRESEPCLLRASGEVPATEMDIEQCGLNAAMAGECRDLVDVPACASKVSQTEMAERVCCESFDARLVARAAGRSSTNSISRSVRCSCDATLRETAAHASAPVYDDARDT